MMRMVFAIALFVLCFTENCSSAGFSSLPHIARTEIAYLFVEAANTKELRLVRTRAENVAYSTWDNPPCPINVFACMCSGSSRMYPAHRALNCLTGFECGISWYSKEIHLLHERENGQILRDKEKGLYRPLILLPSKPILSFVKKLSAIETIPLMQRQISNLNLDAEENTSLSNICEHSAFRLSSVLSFWVDGVEEPQIRRNLTDTETRIVELNRRIAALRGGGDSLITLTKREATEMVYVTALCRCVIGSMKEFNEKYLGKGPQFIVELTDPKCETEFGRMLYDAAKSKGLLYGRGGGDGKSASKGNVRGKELR